MVAIFIMSFADFHIHLYHYEKSAKQQLTPSKINFKCFDVFCPSVINVCFSVSRLSPNELVAKRLRYLDALFCSLCKNHTLILAISELKK